MTCLLSPAQPRCRFLSFLPTDLRRPLDLGPFQVHLGVVSPKRHLPPLPATPPPIFLAHLTPHQLYRPIPTSPPLLRPAPEPMAMVPLALRDIQSVSLVCRAQGTGRVDCCEEVLQQSEVSVIDSERSETEPRENLGGERECDGACEGLRLKLSRLGADDARDFVGEGEGEGEDGARAGARPNNVRISRVARVGDW